MSVLARGTKPYLREGLAIVRQVLTNRSDATGLTTHELFNLAVNQPPSKKIDHEPLSPSSITYGKGGKARISAPLPPHPEHPVRSLSFLKSSILPILEGQKEIKRYKERRIPFISTSTVSVSPTGKQNNGKGQQQSSAAQPASPVTVWVWKPLLYKPKPIKAPRKAKPVLGAEVGVGEDWSHLNKRRQRARVGKLRRERTKMMVLKNIARRRWKNKKLREEREKSGTESPIAQESANSHKQAP